MCREEGRAADVALTTHKSHRSPSGCNDPLGSTRTVVLREFAQVSRMLDCTVTG